MKKFLIVLLFSAQVLGADYFQVGESLLHINTNYDLQRRNENITQLLIVIHGTLRNGSEYFQHALEAAQSRGVDKHTLIVAPTFRRSDDPKTPKELYWGRRWSTKWKYGYLSEGPEKISSFAVIDRLLSSIAKSGNFPSLKKIVMTGHSAGGQFTQRYAAGAEFNEIDITFIPSNPSSYLYFHPTRFNFTDGNYKSLSIDTEQCEYYNHYIYGIDIDRYFPDYYKGKDLLSNYKSRNITYLMAEEDKETDLLDRSCEANLQGVNRIERAFNYHYYAKKFFDHRFVSIPGIGHDHQKVFNSNEAAEVLFGLTSERSRDYLYNKVGNTDDVKVRKPSERYIQMQGGGPNDHDAYKDFLNTFQGGDLIVLSGKSQLHHRYTHSFWRMGVPLNSVETISLLSSQAGNDPFVLEKVGNADGIFFTGGDQSKYINLIKGTKLEKLLHKKLAENIPFSGTSAGMAIMGEYFFSAQEGGVSSGYALANPMSPYITIENNFFFNLKNLITDTHFSERNREGRLLAFMYKAQQLFSENEIYGVGVDEGSALTIKGDRMQASGAGGVYFYSAMNTGFKSLVLAPLNYKNIGKVVLKKNIDYPIYSDLDFSQELIHVEDGVIK